MSAKITKQELQKRIDDHFGENKYQVINCYGIRNGADLKCLKCGKEFFYKDLAHIYRKVVMCSCFNEEKKNCDSISDIQNKIDDKFGINEFTVLDFNRSTNKLKIKHKCGFIRQIDRARFYDRGLCPQCNKSISSGEKNIASILLSLNIPFETQKTFENLFSKNGRHLRFDFFVDNKYIIEFNGMQHYNSVEFFGGKERFVERQELDEIKYDYCKNNNIPLLIIPYWESKNMRNIIISFLKSNDYPVMGVESSDSK